MSKYSIVHTWAAVALVATVLLVVGSSSACALASSVEDEPVGEAVEAVVRDYPPGHVFMCVIEGYRGLEWKSMVVTADLRTCRMYPYPAPYPGEVRPAFNCYQMGSRAGCENII
ncbi:hypothetical protein [Sorangium cellulosum]|uniref:hypothetical protein n=1 Tax=Sorangium cellulosum TaxID=56 RepID=UPI0011DDC6DA|nr:hypothetical protein [Sorangium cellulosum]